jgi:hypothetical protein
MLFRRQVLMFQNNQMSQLQENKNKPRHTKERKDIIQGWNMVALIITAV